MTDRMYVKHLAIAYPIEGPWQILVVVFFLSPVISI